MDELGSVLRSFREAGAGGRATGVVSRQAGPNVPGHTAVGGLGLWHGSSGWGSRRRFRGTRVSGSASRWRRALRALLGTCSLPLGCSFPSLQLMAKTWQPGQSQLHRTWGSGWGAQDPRGCPRLPLTNQPCWGLPGVGAGCEGWHLGTDQGWAACNC